MNRLWHTYTGPRENSDMGVWVGPKPQMPERLDVTGYRGEDTVTDTFRPGQRVRVSYETTVDAPVESGRAVLVRHPAYPESGRTRVPASAVELIDDPASDPVGTVRRSASTVVVKTDLTPDRDPWCIVVGSVNHDYWCTNSEVVGWEIIGPVPGTPAARVLSTEQQRLLDALTK